MILQVCQLGHICGYPYMIQVGITAKLTTILETRNIKMQKKL